MQIEVDVKAAEVLLRLRKGEKRMVYAVSNAIRDTALDAQKAIHDQVRKSFIIRKPAFFFGSPGRPGGVAAKVDKPSPTAGRLVARVYTGEGSKGGQVLLPKFERGGERRPFTPGAQHVAVPLLGRPARPNIARGVPPAFTFAGLKFKAYRAGKVVRRRRRGRTVNQTPFGEYGRLRPPTSGEVQWKGLQRTFIIPNVGVFQRIGPDRGDVRMIYAFKRPFKLDTRLNFVATGTAAVRNVYRGHMLKWIGEAFAFHGTR